MADHIEISPDDARFAAAVGAVIEKRIPLIVRTERFLAVPVLLLAAGLLSLGVWAGKIVWDKYLEDYINAAMQKSEGDPKSPVSRLFANVVDMSKTVNETFETQVDSATFKVLRFGCTPPGTAAVPEFPPCESIKAGAGLAQSLEDQKILLIANPSKQIIHVEISVMPYGDLGKWEQEQLLLQIDAVPPPVRATAAAAKNEPLALTPEQLGTNGRGLLRDGRLLLNSAANLPIVINLTPSLAKRGDLTGPIQLRFTAVKEQPSTTSSSPGAIKLYTQSPGTELFRVKTLTSTYHSIPAIQTPPTK